MFSFDYSMRIIGRVSHRAVSLILIGLLALSGCGFHLKGNEKVPAIYQLIYVKIDDQYSVFVQNFKNQVPSSEILFADSQRRAPVTIHITQTDWQTERTGVQTSSQARIYNITYTISFQLENRNAQLITNNQTLKVKRQLILKSGQLLEANEQYSELQEEMRDDMVQKLIANLSSHSVQSKVRQSLNNPRHAKQ